MIYRILSVLAITLISSVYMTAQVSEKTKTQDLTLSSCPDIALQVGNAKIQYKEWSETYPKIEIRVDADVPLSVLQKLKAKGRYELTANNCSVKAPNIKKSVTVYGQSFQERVSVTVHVPAGGLKGSTFSYKGQAATQVHLNLVSGLSKAEQNGPPSMMGISPGQNRQAPKTNYGDILINSEPPEFE